MVRQFVQALDNAEIVALKNQRVADEALANFKAKHHDLNVVFPLGIKFTFGDGDGEVTETAVRDVIAKRYAREKERKQLHDEVRAENSAIKALMDAGWRPPAPQEEVTARRRIVRQPDGSALVEELD